MQNKKKLVRTEQKVELLLCLNCTGLALKIQAAELFIMTHQVLHDSQFYSRTLCPWFLLKAKHNTLHAMRHFSGAHRYTAKRYASL